MKTNPKYLRKINEGAVGVNVLRKDDTVVGVEWYMEGTTKVFNIFVGFCNNPKVNDCRAIRQAYRSIDKQETRTRGVGELIALKGMVKELCEQIVNVTTTPFAIMIHSNGEPQRLRVYSRLMREEWNLDGRKFKWFLDKNHQLYLNDAEE